MTARRVAKRSLDELLEDTPPEPQHLERASHDYIGHGTSSLPAAIDGAVPAELEVHLACDNLAIHKTATVLDRLTRHLKITIVVLSRSRLASPT